MKLVSSIVFSYLLIFVNSALADFGVVDMKQIEEKSAVTKKLKEDVTKINAKMEKDAEEIKKYVEGRVKKLETAASTLSREKIEKERGDLEKEVMELQTIFREREIAVEEAKIKALDEINEQIKAISKSLAEKKNFTVVLPSNLTVYYNASSDITAEVLTELNNKVKSVKFDVKLKEYKLK